MEDDKEFGGSYNDEISETTRKTDTVSREGSP